VILVLEPSVAPDLSTLHNPVKTAEHYGKEPDINKKYELRWPLHTTDKNNIVRENEKKNLYQIYPCHLQFC